MTTEEIKSAIAQLIEARHTLKKAQKLVEDAENSLTDMFRSEETILDEWNTIAIDEDHWDLKFNLDEAFFESLTLNRFKHF
jgi:hypothetical protein